MAILTVTAHPQEAPKQFSLPHQCPGCPVKSEEPPPWALPPQYWLCDRLDQQNAEEMVGWDSKPGVKEAALGCQGSSVETPSRVALR